MLVSELGEFGLIERIARKVRLASPGVVVGIGDDTAVLKCEGGRYLLATCDVQVAGVHFLPGVITPQELGRKAVAINLSDIASMGGVPEHLLVSLILTPDTTVEFIDDLYRGIEEECQVAGVDMVGGNMASSPSQLAVDITLLGWVEPEALLLRSGAKPGDLILVTGQVGNSAAGLALISRGSDDLPGDAWQKLRAAHLTPRARLKEGRAIGKSHLASAMIDISDGLAQDLGHICEESQVGAELWERSLPVSLEARELAGKMGKEALEWALFGGEDYELLFTAPEATARDLAREVEQETGTSISIIGRVLPSEEGVFLLTADGRREPLGRGGWDHFRRKEGR